MRRRAIGSCISRPCSSRTRKKKSHCEHLCSLSAYVPCTSPRQNVPATTQHARPELRPPCTPSNLRSVAAGQTPSVWAFAPYGSRPHLLNSQQLDLLIVAPCHCCVPLSGFSIETASGITLPPQRSHLPPPLTTLGGILQVLQYTMPSVFLNIHSGTQNTGTLRATCLRKLAGPLKCSSLRVPCRLKSHVPVTRQSSSSK